MKGSLLGVNSEARPASKEYRPGLHLLCLPSNSQSPEVTIMMTAGSILGNIDLSFSAALQGSSISNCRVEDFNREVKWDIIILQQGIFNVLVLIPRFFVFCLLWGAAKCMIRFSHINLFLSKLRMVHKDCHGYNLWSIDFLTLRKLLTETRASYDDWANSILPFWGSQEQN